MNDLSAVATFFKEGGIFMYFMLATAVMVIAISVERFIVLRHGQEGWNRYDSNPLGIQTKVINQLPCHRPRNGSHYVCPP